MVYRGKRTLLTPAQVRARQRANAARRRARERALARKAARKLIPVGMPASQVVKLKYVATFTLNPTASGPDYKYFSANGMRYPEVSELIGHAPLYFEQFMANYDHYQVLGSSIRVTQLPFTSDSKNPAVWGIIKDDETTFSYTNAAQVIESNQGKGKYRLGSASVNTSTNTNGRQPKMICKFSAKKELGDLSDKHEGGANANPIDQMYFGIWAASVGGATDPDTLSFMAEISYIAKLKEPKFIAQSHA